MDTVDINDYFEIEPFETYKSDDVSIHLSMCLNEPTLSVLFQNNLIYLYFELDSSLYLKSHNKYIFRTM